MFAAAINMHPKSHMTSAVLYAIAILCLVPGILACSARTPAAKKADEASTAARANESADEIWSKLLQKTPFPHTAPLPPREPAVLDGTYTKFDPKKKPPVPCRRCPDYLPEGGLWKLHLSKGVFRIFHEFTGWRSIGSYVVEGNRIRLFNDPTCIEVTGHYTWTYEAGRLIWVVIQDECAIGLRAKNLMKIPWTPCQPPSMEAGFSGPWDKPPGCN